MQEKSQDAATSVEMQFQIQHTSAQVRLHGYEVYLKNLLNSMPRRLQDVIRREQNPIKY
jgi:hypothetical protein